MKKKKGGRTIRKGREHSKEEQKPYSEDMGRVKVPKKWVLEKGKTLRLHFLA